MRVFSWGFVRVSRTPYSQPPIRRIRAPACTLYTPADRTFPKFWLCTGKSMTRPGLKTLVFVLVVLVEQAALGQSALTAQAVEAKLKTEPYLMIRGMYAGNHLAFDDQGNLIGSADAVAFSMSAVLVDQVQVTDTQIRIDGARAALQMQPSPDEKAPESVTAIPWNKHKRDKITITVARDAQHSESTEAALAKVVSIGLDDRLLSTAPGYWQPWLRHQLHPSAPEPPDTGAEPMTLNGKLIPGVTPPRLLFAPVPKYSSQARHWLFEGKDLIGVVVDTSGHPEDVHIVRAVGMGLDESAIDVVKRYRFSAALKDGTPIPTQINIEVNFRVW
jgi:TonB family protein